MDAQRQAMVETLYHAALAKEPGERSSYLAGACAEDPALRSEVESLLARAEAPQLSPAEHPEATALADEHTAIPVNAKVPSGQKLDGGAWVKVCPQCNISFEDGIDRCPSDGAQLEFAFPGGPLIDGKYRVQQRLGRGGMGEVWLAEQKSPVRRRVALKLIKAGMDTREIVARFESERQALALMDHPAIAKVFDAGSTPQARPYFAMEYVPGIPITAYCDKHKLSLRERLQLFVRVCEGVQHAHQKAIIHRDLKPANILVGDVDGRPLPKIIDFGVAKALSQPLTGGSVITRLGSVIGTPEYMSPEQADSAGEDVDTRTDVYSLGVILYELMVGVLPLDFRKLPFDEIVRKLREEDAPRPSTKLRTLGRQSTITAQNRRTEVRTVVRQLHGDLDAIALKALEKDRSRRYGSALELAADIERHLRNQPVTARPASVGYRARKYFLRHRLGVVAAASFVLLLAVFAITEAVQVRRVTRERDRADRITAFMTGMFKVTNPSEARGRNITAREILDKASKEVDKGLANDPELQAQLMYVMGIVYRGLGLYTESRSLLTQSLAIRRRILGLENPATLTSMNALAHTIRLQGQYAEAEKLTRQTFELRRRLLGPEHPDTLASMDDLAVVLRYEGHFAEAEKLSREVLAVRRRLISPENPALEESMNNLAIALIEQGHYAEAEKLERETVDLRRRLLGSNHPSTLQSMNNLAMMLLRERKYGEADSLQREVLGILRRVYGPDHPKTAQAEYNLACIVSHMGQPDQALLLLRGAIDHGLVRFLALGMGKDPDLSPLSTDPRFEALVAYARQHAMSSPN
ncbi:MAG: serine/threonine protein kinase [Acidobacteriaceae bacterium]|nr:serine/threonine protein kinase [Acidobacteriaceae bacterium]